MDFVSGAIALSLIGGGTVGAVALTNSGPECVTKYEMKVDGVAKVTRCGGVQQKAEPSQIIAKPAKGTGGLILRDVNGRDLGSGIGERQTFIFVNCGPVGSGLIDVMQLDTAKDEGITGGWGKLYGGFVKKAYTANPSDYPCK